MPPRGASLCAAARDADAAFGHLDRALLARDPAMIDLPVSPLWRPLRDDPRFAMRVERIGLDARHLDVDPRAVLTRLRTGNTLPPVRYPSNQ